MNNFWTRVSEFLLGKGFYIVLLLSVATIGISGYFFLESILPQPEQEQRTGAGASVVLPAPEQPEQAQRPAVQTSPAPPAAPQGQEEGQNVPPEDDPQPVEQGQPASAQQPDPAPPVATVFTWPVKGEVLRDFSVETLSPDPTLGDWRTHAGLDIASAAGTKVLAMGAGRVCEVFEDGRMGTTVVIDHGNGLSTTYANLADEVAVEPGDVVDTGTVIGAVGATALVESALGDHLHLEAVCDGAAVDPRDYLPPLG